MKYIKYLIRLPILISCGVMISIITALFLTVYFVGATAIYPFMWAFEDDAFSETFTDMNDAFKYKGFKSSIPFLKEMFEPLKGLWSI